MAQKRQTTSAKHETQTLSGVTFEIASSQPELNEWQDEVSRDVKERYLEESLLRLQDIKWRLQNRENLKNFLTKPLVVQNVAVFSLVAVGMWYDKVQGLEPVFSILVGGTILETTGIIYIIVRWLFSEISYEKNASV